MPHAYTEDQLVEQPAIGLFAELGWSTVSALEEVFGANGTLLRETQGGVVLVSRLRGVAQGAVPRLHRHAADDDWQGAHPRGLWRLRCQRKCSAIFEHVYEGYCGEGAGIYAAAM